MKNSGIYLEGGGGYELQLAKLLEPKTEFTFLNTGVRNFRGSAHLALMFVTKTTRREGGKHVRSCGGYRGFLLG